MTKVNYEYFPSAKQFKDLELGKAFFELKDLDVVNFFRSQVLNDSFDYPYILIIKYLKSLGLKPHDVLNILRKHSVILLNIYLKETNLLANQEDVRLKAVDPLILSLKDDISVDNLKEEIKGSSYLVKLYNGEKKLKKDKKTYLKLFGGDYNKDLKKQVENVLMKSQNYFSMNKFIKRPDGKERNNFDLMIAENYYEAPLDMSLEMDEENYIKLINNFVDTNKTSKSEQKKAVIYLALSLSLDSFEPKQLKTYSLGKGASAKNCPLVFMTFNKNSNKVIFNFKALKEPFQVKFRNELIEFSKEGVKNITKNVLK